MDCPKISVIVPVYNTGELLKETVARIQRQTLKDFELLLVDDGSAETTSAICDSLAEQDSRIRVIHKQNGGICSARNVGIAQAHGDYIAFCDHDDNMYSDCLQKALEAALKYEADVVRYRRAYSVLTEQHEKSTNHMKPFESEFFSQINWDNYIKIIRSCGYGVWAGIVKKSFVQQHSIAFDESVKYGYEDHIFTARCLVNASKVYILNEELYEWMQRISTSTSCKMSDSILENRLYAIKKWCEQERILQSKYLVPNATKNYRNIDYLNFGACEIRNNTKNLARQKNLFKELKNLLGIQNGPISGQASLKKRIVWMVYCNNWMEILALKDSLTKITKKG